MKVILFAALVLLSSSLIGQLNQDTLDEVNISELYKWGEIGKKFKYSEDDTIPILVDLNNTRNEYSPQFYLNENMIDGHILQTLDSKKIDEVIVEKDEISSSGIVYIKTKRNYEPKFISLNELKLKYIDIPINTSTLFMLNGNVINRDFDEFFVDENYILKIEFQNVYNSKESLDIFVINLITRTKENLAKANTIKIR